MTSSVGPDHPARPGRPNLEKSGNLLDVTAPPAAGEAFETLFQNAHLRIQRIVSSRHASPEGFWYDQPDDEWVMVVRGEASLAFEDGRRREMGPGDWVLIPARCRHRVQSTGPDTVWLAVHAHGGEHPG